MFAWGSCDVSTSVIEQVAFMQYDNIIKALRDLEKKGHSIAKQISISGTKINIQSQTGAYIAKENEPVTISLDYPFSKEDYPYYIIWKYDDRYAEVETVHKCLSWQNIKYTSVPYPIPISYTFVPDSEPEKLVRARIFNGKNEYSIVEAKYKILIPPTPDVP
ncbi:MAG: hypothetical protein NTX50_22815 [Candidatus Sumerlaeota bacterium]|nr:hypothetical protein [Candidatus Sumerlaeota bacterium]